MDKMTLLLFGRPDVPPTQRADEPVLGAVTRTSDPDTELAAEVLVGDGLPVRDPVSGEDFLVIAPNQLRLEAVTKDDAVLANPYRYVLVNGSPTIAAELPDNTITLNLTPTPGQLKYTLPAVATTSYKVWISIRDESGYVQQVRINVPAFSPVIDPIPKTMTLSSGAYRVLTIVPGFPRQIVEKKVP